MAQILQNLRYVLPPYQNLQQLISVHLFWVNSPSSTSALFLCCNDIKYWFVEKYCPLSWIETKILIEVLFLHDLSLKTSIVFRGWCPKIDDSVKIFYRIVPSNTVKEVPLLLFWRETCPQTSSPEFLSRCDYNSWKNLNVTDLWKIDVL